MAAENEVEIWDLALRLDTGVKNANTCNTEDCKLKAVAMWSNGKDDWYTCEACQELDFGGWPAIAQVPPPDEKTESFVELESTSSVDEPVTSKILVDSSVLHKEHGVGVVLNVGSKAIVWKDKNGKTRKCPAAELTTTPLSPLNSKPLCASTAETLVTVNVAVATQAAATSINLACTPGPAVESASNAITANVNAEVAVKAAKNAIDIAKSTDSSSAAVAMGVMEAVAKAKEASDAAKLSTTIAKALNEELPGSAPASTLPSTPLDPVWDIVRTFENDPTAGKCETETCSKTATCLWACALEEWRTCLDCQETDFGGWPVGYKIPPQFRTTGKPVPTLPTHELISNVPPKPSVFADSDSDSDDDMPFPAKSSLLSPVSKKNDKDNKSVTPSPMVPSSSLLQIQAKWLKEAQAIDRKAKIITKVPEAMKAIHAHLHREGKPMNITGLFESLKKTIPNAILRKSIDKMVEQGNRYRGNGSPDDCLRKREGKKSSSTLYFAFEEEPRGPHEQNETTGEITLVKAELKDLDDETKKITDQALKNQSQPKNTALDTNLATLSESVSNLTSSRDEAAKHTVDEKALKKMHSAHAFYVDQWKKRKAKCVTGLNNLEHATDGVIITKKCLSGTGQIEIESDERIAKEAVSTFKFKGKSMSSKKRKLNPSAGGDQSFVAIELDKESPRGVKRVFAGN